MSEEILSTKTDKEKVAFMKSALTAIREHLEGGFTDSAHSIANTCLAGVEFGTDSPEFIALLTVEVARLKSSAGGMA